VDHKCHPIVIFLIMPRKTSQSGIESKLPAGLYIVATPIGNLEDITHRALRVLHSADHILCEDTRVSQKLLNHYDILKPLISYHDHNAESRRPEALRLLAEGNALALISDAGTPLISDPGYKLVESARAEGHKVFPIPGPSSVMAALSAAGMPTDRFLFCGFPPTKMKAREDSLRELITIPATLVFFESTKRLPEALEAMHKVFGARQASVARELTKIHEEFRSGTLAELSAHYSSEGAPKGEAVILINPPTAEEGLAALPSMDTDMLLKKAMEEVSLKDAVEQVTAATGLPRKQLYQRALELKYAS